MSKGRLIDADLLVAEIQKERANGFPANENLTFYALSCVNHAPTAYNIDKVVEELEKELHFYENRMAEMGGTDRDIEDWGAIKRLKDAIEIVKRGGLNNE